MKRIYKVFNPKGDFLVEDESMDYIMGFIKAHSSWHQARNGPTSNWDQSRYTITIVKKD